MTDVTVRIHGIVHWVETRHGYLGQSTMCGTYWARDDLMKEGFVELCCGMDVDCMTCLAAKASE